MFFIVYFYFLVKHQAFQFLSDYSLTPRNPDFLHFPVIVSFIALTLTSKALLQLTSVHFLRIRNLNALAYLAQKYYLCIEMSGKGSISRMSDECLMKQETVFSFYTQYQAVMRKFTLAGKPSQDSYTRMSEKNSITTDLVSFCHLFVEFSRPCGNERTSSSSP